MSGKSTVWMLDMGARAPLMINMARFRPATLGPAPGLPGLPGPFPTSHCLCAFRHLSPSPTHIHCILLDGHQKGFKSLDLTYCLFLQALLQVPKAPSIMSQFPAWHEDPQRPAPATTPTSSSPASPRQAPPGEGSPAGSLIL